ncbi:HupE/UreJ family protein [Arenibacter sp. GZD96]|uniref:HupE/UreJ family protein n=1 Tax=Aurantibrevibacter litoralis TaxID=3106030 RepID=UPI002AFF29FE|nr:HupE/UreJ family protein [Arenibacter sp. GZD-96]MEA1786616.1 HupE/UreJ family protein [Arenibacter sp. GZD-96]
MEDFWFYVQLGFHHVLDLGAYDHILFLAALAAPFTLSRWKQILLLATIFTIAHCTSLALSAFDTLTINVALIEFLIPVTIMATAVFNLVYIRKTAQTHSMSVLGVSTTFFGLIHGFGFSNYFRMLMAEEDSKSIPLLAFASGIELSQVLIIGVVLLLAYVVQSFLKIPRTLFVTLWSVLILVITIPLLINTFPW